MALDLDPRFTFDAFVVGPGNRLATAAARRVADTPGSTYNPLFVYGGSGLGKTHLLCAIGHQVQRGHGYSVTYETLEHLVERISAAVEAGELDAFREGLRDTHLLLVDDVQFMAGRRQAQEELMRAWDAIASRGGQVVLACDRPPQEIDALDERLLTRLSGGLLVDTGPPDYETRIAIARRKADERGAELGAEVIQALARIAFTNVRELQGALNRLIAVQELESREVGADEVPTLLGAAAERGPDEFGEFLSDISGTVTAVVEEGDRTIADAILTWEGEGIRTGRLDAALAGTLSVNQAEELVRRFEHDVRRLRAIRAEIEAREPDAPELAGEVLANPDRLADAEALLHDVRARQLPPPPPAGGPSLDDLGGTETMALRAARAVAASPGGAYNPLYVLGPAGSGKSTLLMALGQALAADGERAVAYIEATTFAEELVGALERSRLDAWRTRYRKADVLIIDDVDRLEGSERAHEELFHLFEDLHRDGRQLAFAAEVPPADLPLPTRLRSRLEAGLVVELDRAGDGAPASTGKGDRRVDAAGAPQAPVPTVEAGIASAPPPEASATESPDAPTGGLDREKVLLEWPYAADCVVETTD
jgi:chromosomal replication initiator protein